MGQGRERVSKVKQLFQSHLSLFETDLCEHILRLLSEMFSHGAASLSHHARHAVISSGVKTPESALTEAPVAASQYSGCSLMESFTGAYGSTATLGNHYQSHHHILLLAAIKEYRKHPQHEAIRSIKDSLTRRLFHFPPSFLLFLSRPRLPRNQEGLQTKINKDLTQSIQFKN